LLDVFQRANNNIFIRKMEFLDAVFPDETYYTEFGELRFYENPKPKFAFYNQKAKKSEIVCYSSTIRAVANCLPEAQAVARAYIAGKKRNPTLKRKERNPLYLLPTHPYRKSQRPRRRLPPRKTTSFVNSCLSTARKF